MIQGTVVNATDARFGLSTSASAAANTTALTAFLTYLGANGGSGYIPAGTYNVATVSTLTNPTKAFRLYGDGIGATVLKKATANTDSMMQVSGASAGTVIEDMTFDGAFDTLANGNHGLIVYDSSNVRVRRVEVKKHKNTAILVYAAAANTKSNVVIEDCHVDGNSAANNGLLIADMNDSGMRGCTAKNIPGSPGYGLQLKNDCRRCFIEDVSANTCEAGVAFGQDGGVGVKRSRVSNVKLFDAPLVMGYAEDCHLSDIIVDSNSSATDDPINLDTSCLRNTLTNIHVLNVAGAREAVRFRASCAGNVVHLAYVQKATGNIVGFDATSASNVALVGQLSTYADTITVRNDGDATNLGRMTKPAYKFVASDGSARLVLRRGATTSLDNANHLFALEDAADIHLAFKQPSNTSIGGLQFSNPTTAGVGAMTYNMASPASNSYCQFRANGTDVLRIYSSVIRPVTDNAVPLGNASFRLTELFAAAGAINTSDEREKQDIEPIPDVVLDAWADVEFYRFRWRAAVSLKGDSARWHFGFVAQRVKHAFEARGLDPFALGLLCWDRWEDTFDAEGKLEAPAGDRYGIRYEEALVLEAALMRRELRKVRAA